MDLEKVKPQVVVELQGKPYVIVFDKWALSLIEEERGDDFLVKAFKKLTAPKVYFLLWAALVRSKPELDGVTPAERRSAQKTVVDLCEGSDVQELAKQVAMALRNAFPNSEPEKNEQGATETQQA